MSTSIRLLGWEARGLRCPDHQLNFEARQDETWPVTLIQMPNGTGKTTTLILLRGVLSGEFEDRGIWPKERIQQLQKKDFDDDAGQFRVDLLVSDQRLTIVVNFDFGKGSASYKTSFGSGQKTGFVPPSIVHHFLRSGFVNFFVFDGELAEQLLSAEHTDAERAIEDLFQLSTFHGMASAIDEYWDYRTASRTATEQRGLSRRKQKVKWLRDRLRKLKQNQNEKQIEHEEVKAELAQLRTKFEERISTSQKKATFLQEKERAFQESKNLVANLSNDLLAQFRLPASLSESFATKVLELKNNLDRVKLPESAAKEFFQELLEEAQCVCGREIDATARKKIQERAAKYLGSDEVSLLNALKSDVEKLVGDDPRNLHHAITEIKERLIDETKRRQRRKNELEMAKLAASEDDPLLGKVHEQIREMELRLENLRAELQKYDDTDDGFKDENTYSIPVISRRLDDAEKKLAEIAHTIELKEKRDILKDVIKSAHQSARAQLITEVVDESNDRISALMPYNAIRIRDIEHSLRLEEQEGGSVGETLCVAYAFLSTLFARTKHELPFVVDSPAGSIDLRVRAQVAELVPKLTNQFIAFIISTEREGFLDSLERSVESKVQYVTLFRSSVENAGVTVDSSDKLVESGDGKTVLGRHFFRGFHIDTEE